MLSGPMEEFPWPEKLTARVVSPGPRPRIHGYDVEGDLALHYSFAETVLLTLTGEPPDPVRGKAFEIALIFLSPITIAEAPTHAAAIARLAGSRASGVLATGAIGLSEQASFILETHREFLETPDKTALHFPERFRARSDEEREIVKRLKNALPVGFQFPGSEEDPAPIPALLGVIHACGIKKPEEMQVVLVLARLASLFAEASTTRPGRINDYPMNLPSFRYSEGGNDE